MLAGKDVSCARLLALDATVPVIYARLLEDLPRRHQLGRCVRHGAHRSDIGVSTSVEVADGEEVISLML